MVGLGAGSFELLQLLVKVLVELDALDDGGVGLLELLAVEVDEDDLDVVDQLVDPGQVQKRAVDGLGGRVASRQSRQPEAAARARATG